MRPLHRLIAAALLGLAAVASPISAQSTAHSPRAGNDVAGIWRATWVASGGVPVSIWLTLKRDGAAVTGSVRMTWGPEEIKTGRFEGDRLHLAFGNPVVPITLDGRLVAGRLRLVLTEPRRAPLALTAVRVAVIPGPPARLPLPPARDIAQAPVARTPPMGWSSWNFLNERIDDRTVRNMADALVKTGLRDAGYTYVNIDDGWAGGRGRDGRIRANAKFPDMKALAAYVHARGLKLGLYTSPGPTTCGGYPASYGHIAADMKQFADWGVDYVKVDWCTAGAIYGWDDMRAVYQAVGEAIAASGRAMVFDVCQYGIGDVARWAPTVGGHMWRTSGDIGNSWTSVYANALANEKTASFAGPGRWNNPDMMQVGNGKLTPDEARTHMNLWAINAAPLQLGNDLTAMTPETIAILANRAVIAIDQDALGHQGTRVAMPGLPGGVTAWTRPLANGDTALLVVNGSEAPVTIAPPWRDPRYAGATVRDLWAGQDLTPVDALVTLAPHASRMVRIAASPIPHLSRDVP